MSEEDQQEFDNKPFVIEKAKTGRAVCKKCKQKCVQGEIRIAKLAANPFGSGKMKLWHHIDCIFELFVKQRPTTKRIEDPDDLYGWEQLDGDNQQTILTKIDECNREIEQKYGIKVIPKPKATINDTKPSTSNSDKTQNTSKFDSLHKDNSFREFRRLVVDITNISSYLEKTKIVNNLFTKGSDGGGFKGDIILWCRLLLPGFVKRIYNLKSKQLIKLFSRIFQTNHDAMLEDLEQGDISETIQKFFEKNHVIKPSTKSTLTLEEIDDFLEQLSQLTKEDEQIEHFKKIIKKCTGNDLKVIIRLINHDLRMNAGAKHILDGVHPDAYDAYQSSRDITDVLKRCLNIDDNTKIESNIKATIQLMTPVLPMLAEACKTVEYALTRCPNGFYSEVKYDGERVQVHKRGNEFKYFSRSLKPVLAHKVAQLKEFIPQAFPHGKDLILDSEILMIDTQTGKPLPFGTLGVHKKNEFKDATVCLFVFDCIYYNGEILTDKPLKHRKKILKETMIEISNHVVFSEIQEIYKSEDLARMIGKVLKLGLEGLVLKDFDSIYEPGKRRWLKIKKDYLFGGSMADSADLIVLGAWYGTGKKGGMMSIFLMGCYDPNTKKFCTVTKVSSGHDDKTLDELQNQLDMIKISGDSNRLPNWLKCTKTMVPDFVAKNPKQQPIWEIVGAEFTQHDVHTAGISIRFPRVTRIRDDKNWETATNLDELWSLFKNSKEHNDLDLLMEKFKDEDDNTSPKNNNNKRKKQNLLDNFVKIEKSPKKPKIEINLKNPLPDYFANIKIILHDNIEEEYREIIRYFIAYGGTILSNEEKLNASHCIHLENTLEEPEMGFKSNTKHVTIDWLKASIANRSVENFAPYIVKWKGRKS